MALQGPDGAGKAERVGGCADLIGDDAHLVTFGHQPQHGFDEIIALGRIDPGRADDQRRRVMRGGGLFTGQLGAAIGTGRGWRRVGAIGLAGLPIKDIIGRHLYEARACRSRCSGKMADGRGIDQQRGGLLGLGLVNRGPGGGIDQQIGLGSGHHGGDLCGIADIEFGFGRGDQGDARRCRRRQRPAQLPATAGDKDLHAKISASASSGAASSLPESCGATPTSGQAMAMVGSFQRRLRSLGG